MILLYILAWLWSAPQELAGLLLVPFYGVTRTEWRGGVLVVTVRRLWGFPSTTGQTFGRLSFRLPTASAWNWYHERRHVTQSDWLGPLFPLAYGIASVVAWLRGRGAYVGNWFEFDADVAANFEWLKKGMGLSAAHAASEDYEP